MVLYVLSMILQNSTGLQGVVRQAPIVRFRTKSAFDRHFVRGQFSAAMVSDRDRVAFLFCNGVVRRVEWDDSSPGDVGDEDAAELGRS